MPLRRSHKKSHHGCTQCKQRRIKCDEARPICGPCRRKQFACKFESFAPANRSSHAQTPHARSELPSGSGPGSRSKLPMLDLELMNQWHTATALSLAHNKLLEEPLRINVPQEALAHSFLMHSLLALSALHLSYTCPVPRRRIYTDAAVTHHDLSLSLCAPLLSNITESNCHALFAFSCLTAIFAFAMQGPEAPPNTQGVVEIFRLVRGAASIVSQARPWIEVGAMRQLLKVGKLRHQACELKYVRELFSHLQSFVEQEESTSPGKDQTTHAVVSQSAGHLLSVFNTCSTSDDPDAILAWPALVDLEYLELMRQEDPTALVVLAHYGTALHLMFDNWWLEGWGRFIIRLVEERLGEERWKIDWLVSVMGEVELQST